MDNKALIDKFYESFNRKDAEGMNACYHSEIVFEDPGFGQLKGERAKDMWRMLCASQKDQEFKVEFSNIQTADNTASVHWEAYYQFSKTGRKVHNKIDATFEFQDGLIIRHIDEFNLRNWAKQALGFQGWLLGGTSFFQRKLQAETNRLLDKFQS